MHSISLSLFREQLKVFLVTLTVLCGILIVYGTTRLLVIHQLPAISMVKLLPYILPEAARYAVPVSLLFAVTTVYGDMAAHNEMVAIKSLGIWPLHAFWPGIILAILLAAPTLWMSELALSWGKTGVRNVVLDSVPDIIHGALQRNGSYSTEEFAITAKSVDDGVLRSPTLTLFSKGTKPAVFVSGTSAALSLDPATSELKFEFASSSVTVGDQVSMQLPAFVYTVILNEQRFRVGSSKSYTLPELPAAIDSKLDQIKRLQASLAAASSQPIAESLTQQASIQEQLTKAQGALFYLQAQRHHRLAHAVSCLAFMLFGAPLAVLLQKGDVASRFFMSFLPIVIVFYPLESYLAFNSTFPLGAIWLGDVGLASAGVWLIGKVIRH